MGSSVSGCHFVKKIETSAYVIHRYELRWTVQNFATLALGVGKHIKSELITTDVGTRNDQWQILLYPEGFNQRVDGYVSLWLKRMSENETLVNFTCAILDNDQKQFLKKSVEQKLALESVMGWTTFCKRSVLLKEGNRFLTNGNLCLVGTLDVVVDKDIPHAEIEEYAEERSTEVCKNMRDLLADGAFSDVVIFSGGEEFRVHKAILSARSDVFRTMLKSGLVKNSEWIEIDDISTAAVREMLRFVYSGEVGDIDLETAMELFYAADKYDLGTLKRICARILAMGLSLINAIQILLLADRHRDEMLKDMAVQFISGKAFEIQGQSDWLELMRADPDLANVVVESLAKKQKLKHEASSN